MYVISVCAFLVYGCIFFLSFYVCMYALISAYISVLYSMFTCMYVSRYVCMDICVTFSTQLPFPGIDRLKESRVGRTCMFLYRHPKETPAMKKLLWSLLEKWARPIHNRVDSYARMNADEVGVRVQYNLPMLLPTGWCISTYLVSVPPRWYSIIPQCYSLQGGAV
jgi:hypothetical protein